MDNWTIGQMSKLQKEPLYRRFTTPHHVVYKVRSLYNLNHEVSINHGWMN